MAAPPQSLAHGSGEWTAIRFTSRWMLGTSGCDIASHAALDETGEIAFRAEPVIGRHFIGQRPALIAVALIRGSNPSWSVGFCVRRCATMIWCLASTSAWPL